jgi:hypothetical protein
MPFFFFISSARVAAKVVEVSKVSTLSRLKSLLRRDFNSSEVEEKELMTNVCTFFFQKKKKKRNRFSRMKFTSYFFFVINQLTTHEKESAHSKLIQLLGHPPFSTQAASDTALQALVMEKEAQVAAIHQKMEMMQQKTAEALQSITAKMNEIIEERDSKTALLLVHQQMIQTKDSELKMASEREHNASMTASEQRAHVVSWHCVNIFMLACFNANPTLL